MKARFWPIAGLVLIAAPIAALMVGGTTAFLGMLMGIAGTGFSVLALWWVIRLAGSAAPASKRASVGTMLIVLAFFVKLPIFIALANLSHRIGGSAPTCFLLGLALVYCTLVGWALANS